MMTWKSLARKRCGLLQGSVWHESEEWVMDPHYNSVRWADVYAEAPLGNWLHCINDFKVYLTFIASQPLIEELAKKKKKQL